MGSVTSTAWFDDAVLAAIAAEAAEAYPNEGCGALLGPRPVGDRRVTVSVPVPNSETGRPRDRFEVSPKDYLAIEDEADRRGLALLGFWHSHPDGEAKPSATDRAYAWEGLLTVIVAVPARVPRAIGAWEIHAPDAPFSPVVIVTNVGKAASGGVRTVTDLSAPEA
jgi:proteasome lid subunit RPN8/RPN11